MLTAKRLGYMPYSAWSKKNKANVSIFSNLWLARRYVHRACFWHLNRSGTRWVGTPVKELAEPESEIANLIEHATHEWQSSQSTGDLCGLPAQD